MVLLVLLGLAWWGVGLVATVFGAGTLAPVLVVAVAVVVAMATRRAARWTAAVVVATCLGIIVWRGSLTPRLDREWLEEYARQPGVTVNGDVVTIEGVRNSRWSTPLEASHAWETRSYALANLRGLDLIVEPFPHSPLMAHTMLSFDFGGDGRVVLSIEARREQGEKYGSIPGGLNQFELTYLFLDERDALGLRALRGDTLYAFPARVTPLKLRAFFLSLAATAENLRTHPRFYRIIRDNCTTAWLQSADMLDTDPVGLQIDSILNGRLARLLHARGLMDTDLSYDEAKERFRVERLVIEHLDDPTFSERIRGAR